MGENQCKPCILHAIIYMLKNVKEIYQKTDNDEDRDPTMDMFISCSYFLTHCKRLQGINIALIKNNRHFYLKLKWINWVLSEVSLAIFYIISTKKLGTWYLID